MINNIHSERNDNENSCARVDAILIRRKDSKSHVKGNIMRIFKIVIACVIFIFLFDAHSIQYIFILSFIFLFLLSLLLISFYK